MTDEELLDLFFARSEEALPALRDKYGAYCAAIARQLLWDSRDVEECLNDCRLTVWNAIPPTRPQHFKGWLGAVVRNRALAIGRANGRWPETVEDAALELAGCVPRPDSAQDEAAAKALGGAITAFLRGEKEDARRAFLRRYWYADSVSEAARRLGWSESKTKTVLFRTRNKLRDYLCKEGYL